MGGIERTPPPIVIFPYDFPVRIPAVDATRLQMTLAIKTSGPPHDLAESVRQAIRDVDPNQPIYEIGSMADRLSEQQGGRRLYLVAFAILGLIAVVLSASGVWGMVSVRLGARSFEIAIRIARGAPLKRIVRGLMGRTLVLAIVGAAAGCAIGYLLAGLIQSQFYGVTSWDPLTYFSTVLTILLLVATVALLPTRRIWRTDPAAVLKSVQ